MRQTTFQKFHKSSPCRCPTMCTLSSAKQHSFDAHCKQFYPSIQPHKSSNKCCSIFAVTYLLCVAQREPYRSIRYVVLTYECLSWRQPFENGKVTAPQSEMPHCVHLLMYPRLTIPVLPAPPRKAEPLLPLLNGRQGCQFLTKHL